MLSQMEDGNRGSRWLTPKPLLSLWYEQGDKEH
jgi:hypothetical protein